jgi:hypothetical protein
VHILKVLSQSPSETAPETTHKELFQQQSDILLVILVKDRARLRLDLMLVQTPKDQALQQSGIVLVLQDKGQMLLRLV